MIADHTPNANARSCSSTNVRLIIDNVGGIIAAAPIASITLAIINISGDVALATSTEAPKYH